MALENLREELAAEQALYDGLRADGAREEREAVVRWLDMFYPDLARMIEAGEHRKEAPDA